MAACELKTLRSPGPHELDSITDVVALRGIHDSRQGPWVAADGSALVEALGNVGGVRLSVFSYDMKNIFVRDGLREIATHLLESLSKHRRECEDHSSIIFVAHDVGGTVVKEALNIATFSYIGQANANYRGIVASTQVFVFMGCPHRCHSNFELEGSLKRLFKSDTSARFSLSSILASRLASIVSSVNQGFLDTKAHLKALVVNVSSIHEDLNKRVFDQYETTMFVPGRNHGTGLFQLFDSASHSALDTDNIAVKIKDKILLAAEELRSGSNPPYSTSTRLALLQRAALQPINACLTEVDDDHRTPPAWALDQIVIRNRMREYETVPFLFFYDAENPLQTAMSLFNHIAVDADSEKLIQFFEFRDWDCRYNSVVSMLCTFLLDIQLHGDWLEKNPVWTLDYLLHLYHRLLLPPDGTDPPSVIWVLANFDPRIESYQLLLSRLNLLAIGYKAKLKFKVLVVNQQLVELDPDIADITFFKTISLKEANDHRDNTYTELGQSEQENEVVLHTEKVAGIDNPDGQTSSNCDYALDSVVRRQFLELIAEFPTLYRVKELLYRLLLDRKDNVAACILLIAWFRHNTVETVPGDLTQRIDKHSPSTTESIFELLCMPLSVPVETKKEWIAALQLVLYSFRNFAVEELRDLEAATSYGHQMGRLKNAASPAPGLCHTSSLLSGITKIRANEVCISHTQFRDFLDLQLSGTGKDATREGKHVRRAHARIAKWCLEYLCNTKDAEFRRFQTADENTSTPEFRDTFLSYAIRYWVPHMKLSDSDAETLASASKFLVKSTHAALWARAYWGLGNPATRGKGPSMSLFAIFAEHGVESLVNAVLETDGDQPPLTRSQYLLGLKWAARNGHIQLVHKLLALEIPGEEPFDSIIYEAFASGDAQISKEVVMAAQRQAGNIQSPLNLLSWAAYYGLAETVDILIPCIPPEVEKQNEWRPVQFTVTESKLFTGGSLQALKMLVAAGFATRDVGPDDDESSSALRLLCKSGASTEAVELLAEALLASSISNTPEQKQEWPKEFASAGEIAAA